jgi:hypothetical protein
VFLTFCLMVLVPMFHSFGIFLNCMFNHNAFHKCNYEDTLLSSDRSRDILMWITIITTNFFIIRWIYMTEVDVYKQRKASN